MSLLLYIDFMILYCTCFAHTGPRVFLNCPLNTPPNHIEMWFINLWNHFIIPYLTATTLDGIKVCECVRIVVVTVNTLIQQSVYSNIITVAIWSRC